MKYCKSCKVPAEDSQTICSKCRTPLSTFGVAPVVVAPIPGVERSIRPEPVAKVRPAAETSVPAPRVRRPAIIAVAACLIAVVAMLAFFALPRATSTPPVETASGERTRPSKGGPTASKLAVTQDGLDGTGKRLKGGPSYSGTAGTNSLPEEVGGNVSFEEISLGNAPPPRRAPRIAVTPPSFDDMGKLLDGLGNGFRYTTLNEDAIRTPGSLDQFDIVFLTCSGWPASWGVVDGGAIREGVSQGTMNPRIAARVGQTLREFVERGGTLYASDLHHYMICLAFPHRGDVISFDQELLSEVLEAERRWIQAKIPQSKIGTVADLMKGAGLSPALSKHFDRLVASLEASSLSEGQLIPTRIDPEPKVRAILKEEGLPATEADIAAISRALLGWEKAILDAYRGRPTAQNSAARPQVLLAERRLKELRRKLVPDFSGGRKQTVDAQVVDQGLRELLGSETLPLAFNTESWRSATFGGDGVTVLVKGTFATQEGNEIEAPLLARFSEGQGTVIFTSFHNEAQNSEREAQLLRYLVFSAVTAKAQRIADKTMFSGGFSPTKRSQISHSSDKDTVTKHYESDTSGPLRFALTFAGGGARLRLTLIAPNGQEYSKVVDSTIMIQATGAPAGKWSYTVDSIEVPYANFPFSVSIGKVDRPGGRR
jgi:hypothetical protein